MRNYRSPMFQHRQYAALAKVIHDCQIDESAKAALRSDLAAMFAGDNPNFDRERFMAASNGSPSNGKDKR